MKINTLSDAEEFLIRFVPPKVKRVYDLRRMYELMELLGNPQDSLRVVHVAGTAGKTSTSYYIAKMLQLSGKRVGLTVSPHNTAVNERVQIDGQPLPEAEFCRLLSEFLDIKGVQELKPTYFELLVAFAYWVFALKKVDYGVVEVGLGGLLDGTNVVSRSDKVCVITDIGLDHVAVLGNTLEEIAFQKAGIIQDHNVVLMLQQQDVVIAVVYDYAAKKHAKLFIHEQSADTPKNMPLFQARNWSLAHDVCEYLANRDDFTIHELHDEALWRVPGRMDVINNFILDGAHNPLKFAALVNSLKKQFPNQKFNFILAMKKAHLGENMDLIAPIAAKVMCVPVSPSQDFHELPGNPDNVIEAAKAAGLDNLEIVGDIQEAIKLAPPDELTVITGSLFLLGQAKEVLLNS